MKMKKSKIFVILILLLLVVFCVVAIVFNEKSDNKKTNNKGKTKVEERSDKKEKTKKKESTQNKESPKKKDNSNKSESSKYITKEYNFKDMNLHFLMDVPKSWEGQFTVIENSYYYDGPYTTASGTVIYDRQLSYSVRVLYVDKITKFRFSLFTIEKVDGRDPDCYLYDDLTFKEINGEKYAMGGPTDIFDGPKDVLERYMSVKSDFVKVMESVRGK